MFTKRKIHHFVIPVHRLESGRGKIAEQDIEKFTIREIINIDMGLFPHKRESSVTIDTKIDVNNSRIEFAPSYPQFYFCFFGKATPLCSSPFFYFLYAKPTRITMTE